MNQRQLDLPGLLGVADDLDDGGAQAHVRDRGELHVHMNGAVPLSTIQEIIADEATSFPAGFDFGRDMTRLAPCKSLSEYLTPWQVLRLFPKKRANLDRLAQAVFMSLAENAVRFVELRSSVLYLTGLQNCTPAQALERLIESTGRAAQQYGIRRGLILTVTRGDYGASNLCTLLQAYEDIGLPKDVVGLDLAGDEETPYSAELPAMIREAKDRYGFGVTIHAGETGRVENVRAAVELFHADRIGHGTAAGKDPDLMDLLAAEGARLLQRFAALKEALEPDNRSPNLGDILTQAGGGQADLSFKLMGNQIQFTLSAVGDQAIYTVPVYLDELSGFRYFFVKLPIQYLRHDDRINPRAIGSNISKLVEEFYAKRPQLHVPLAWMTSKDDKSAVHVFDGQHKAAAQIMLGAKAMPVRVFIDPDPDTLITTNTNAGTTLKQVAFDKSVQRHLGSTLYRDRIERFRTETNRQGDDLGFSERDLVLYFKGQSREMKRYILDAVRDGVTSSADNKLRDFVDYGGRGKERPLSYSSIDKTFYSFFIYQEVLDTPLHFGLEDGQNPRELETSQLIRLMNVIAEEIYIGKFDSDIGTDKIESQLQKGTNFPLPHLRAFRMSKEEVLYNWLKFVEQIAYTYFVNTGMPTQKERLFQYPFPEQLWTNIRNFVRNLAGLPLWANKDLSETVFGGKANNSFWETVFATGKSPQGVQVMPKGLNLVEMIK